MADAIMKRQVTALIGRCYAGLDVADLRDEVLRRSASRMERGSAGSP